VIGRAPEVRKWSPPVRELTSGDKKVIGTEHMEERRQNKKRIWSHIHINTAILVDSGWLVYSSSEAGHISKIWCSCRLVIEFQP
jgi:hypothetical protein